MASTNLGSNPSGLVEVFQDLFSISWHKKSSNIFNLFLVPVAFAFQFQFYIRHELQTLPYPTLPYPTLS